MIFNNFGITVLDKQNQSHIVKYIGLDLFVESPIL